MDTACPAALNTSHRILSQQQIDDYAADGYLRFGKILEENQLRFLRQEYDQEIEKARREGYISNLAADDDQVETGDSQMLQVFGVSVHNIWFRKLAHADSILDVVEDLIGPNIRLLQVHLLYKPSHQGSVVYWHQDNFYHQCVPANMVSGWLPLDDVDSENGTMEMIPGSHLRPSWEDWGEHCEMDTSNAKGVELPAGGILFHHCQTLHRSLPNNSGRARRVVVIRFCPIGTRTPRMNTKKYSFFEHPILRMAI